VLVIEPEPGAALAADRDFHLRFVPQVGHEPEAVLLSEGGEDARYALLMVLPPPQALDSTGMATETLFVVDISGSMRGPSMDQARRWIKGMAAGGGTRIDLALETALEMVGRHETWRVERIVFLTDGAVSTEDAMVERIRSHLGSTRLHTLGIGAAPNRCLMRQMAVAGQGLCDFISRVDQAENDIDLFLSRLPDLHAGEPLTLSARFARAAGNGHLVMNGRLGEGRIRRVLDVGAGSHQPTGIATRWASHKVTDLVDSPHEGADAVRQAVVDVSRRFGIVTRHTSLVAVEEFPTANGGSRLVRVANAAPGAEHALGRVRNGMGR